VVIAWVLVMGFCVMFFDEVTSVVDFEMVGEIFLVMCDLVVEGMIMLVVGEWFDGV